MDDFALFLALFFVTSGAFAAEMSDVISDIRCREIAFSQSVESKDFASFKSFLDSDARFVANTVARGPDEIVAAWQVFFSDDGPAIKWRPQFVGLMGTFLI